MGIGKAEKKYVLVHLPNNFFQEFNEIKLIFSWLQTNTTFFHACLAKVEFFLPPPPPPTPLTFVIPSIRIPTREKR